MMAIRKKRKTYALHRWRLHLLPDIQMLGVEIAVLGLDCFRADLIVLAAGIAGRRDDFVEGL